MRVVSLVPSLTEAVAVDRAGGAGRGDRLVHPPGRAGRRPGRRHEVPGPGPGARAASRIWCCSTWRRTGCADAEALRAAGVPVRVTYPAYRAAGARPSWASCSPRWGRRRAGLAAATPGGPGPRRPRRRRPRRGGAGVASAVGGARRRHVRRGRAAPARRGQRLRRAPRTLSPAHPRRAARPRRPSWWCCPTSRTGSPPTTGRRRSPACRRALVSGRHLTWYGPSLAEAPGAARRPARERHRGPDRRGRSALRRPGWRAPGPAPSAWCRPCRTRSCCAPRRRRATCPASRPASSTALRRSSRPSMVTSPPRTCTVTRPSRTDSTRRSTSCTTSSRISASVRRCTRSRSPRVTMPDQPAQVVQHGQPFDRLAVHQPGSRRPARPLVGGDRRSGHQVPGHQRVRLLPGGRRRRPSKTRRSSW